MRCGIRMALGLAGGYLLGRRRNGRLLMLLGAALVSRNLAGKAAQRGAGALASSPEINRLVEQGREAMVSVLSNRIESLTDQLASRTEALRVPGKPGGEPAEEPEQPEAATQEEEEEEEEEEEHEGEERPEERGEAEEEDEEEGPESEEASKEESEAEAEPTPRQPQRQRGSSSRQRATQPRGRATPAGRRTPASQSRR